MQYQFEGLGPESHLYLSQDAEFECPPSLLVVQLFDSIGIIYKPA